MPVGMVEVEMEVEMEVAQAEVARVMGGMQRYLPQYQHSVQVCHDQEQAQQQRGCPSSLRPHAACIKELFSVMTVWPPNP